ncbi:MAG: hypothetical protein IJV22_05655 [Bacteroidales bacterium]|nr:hypothetical protein [Bacteroidales bacterium]
MKTRWSRYIVLILLLLTQATWPGQAQKLIQYESGLGRRDPDNSNVWILCKGVVAVHEGMTLHADSAVLNTAQNDFTAFGNVVIDLTDTTFIYGEELYYDGNARLLDIWGDTVALFDGETELYSDMLSFDRTRNTAYFSNWGHAVNRQDTLDCGRGKYDATTKWMHISVDVYLHNQSSRLYTDSLLYETMPKVAHFFGETTIYSDTTMIRSQQGQYYSGQGYALSVKETMVNNGSYSLMCDTLHYYEEKQLCRAIGRVEMHDTVNQLIGYGGYCESDQNQHVSFLTDSALVCYIVSGDTLYVHADTLVVGNNEEKELEYINAYHSVRMYRYDVQSTCDSAYYLRSDSLLTMYGHPVLWYNEYQCTADTMRILHEAGQAKKASLLANCMVAEKLDEIHYNQIKGKNGVLWFAEGEPLYADILGNAQMVYYLTDTDADVGLSLIGVNVGVGSDIRIYFEKRKANRVVVSSTPDMKAYPVTLLPKEEQYMDGFKWRQADRPKNGQSLFGE